MEYVTQNWEMVAGIITAAVTLASLIAKATPNETDNKVVAILLKIVDALALTTGKTVLKGKNGDVK